MRRGGRGFSALSDAPAAGLVQTGRRLPLPALIEVVLRNGLGVGGIEIGGLIEVVGEGILGDLFCLPTAWAHGKFGLGWPPGRMEEGW